MRKLGTQNLKQFLMTNTLKLMEHLRMSKDNLTFVTEYQQLKLNHKEEHEKVIAFFIVKHNNSMLCTEFSRCRNI